MNIKKIYGSMPEWIKEIVGQVGRYKIIYSSSFRKQYNLLENHNYIADSEMVDKYQIILLKETLKYAYQHIQYYQELFDEIHFNVDEFDNLEELKKIPYLTKQIIRENEEKFKDNSIKNFYYATSGGTSGKPIKIAFDYPSLYKERAFVYHYWSAFGYNYKKSKLITFRELEFNGKLTKKNTIYNELLINPFMLDSDNIKKIVDKIEKFKGDFIYGYPSLIAAFCRLLSKNKIKLKTSVKAIFLISENLYPDQKNRIQEVFNCPIAMFYGHTEKAVFAEKYGDKYIFNPFYGYTEILNDAEDNIVCTGFINRKMPLIRYKVDDKAIPYKDGYKIVGHRENEVLYGKNDYTISATTIEFTHEDCFEKIDSYQFEQNEIGKVEMRLKTDVKLSDIEMKKIYNRVKEKLPYFELNLVVVDELEKTKRGKYKMIIQNNKNQMGGGRAKYRIDSKLHQSLTKDEIDLQIAA